MKLHCQTDTVVAAAQKTLNDFLERAKKMVVVTDLATAAKPVPVPPAATQEAPPTPKKSKFDDLLNQALGD